MEDTHYKYHEQSIPPKNNLIRVPVYLHAKNGDIYCLQHGINRMVEGDVKFFPYVITPLHMDGTLKIECVDCVGMSRPKPLGKQINTSFSLVYLAMFILYIFTVIIILVLAGE